MLELDSEISTLVKTGLYVAAVCDMLDALGYRNQAMHQRLRPLMPDFKACGFIGRARTLSWMETDYVVEEDPYGLEIEAMDCLRPGDVVVHSTDNSGSITPWGALMSTVARKRGAVGCVCDAGIRDCVSIIEMGFPVYYANIRPLDSKGRGIVKAFDVPIRCGEVLVRPGEIIFADFDGVVVVPKEVEQKIFKLAADKVGKENLAQRELGEGRSLRETYARYGVL
jgi:regulator of RNase E activity RraA